MNGIVRFTCGCVGIVLPSEQYQSRGQRCGEDNVLIFYCCDSDFDRPKQDFCLRM